VISRKKIVVVMPAHLRALSVQALAGALSRYKTRANWKWISHALTWAVFVGGAIWRWVHVVHQHDPRDYLYSDMALYVDLAKRFTEAGYEPGVSDMAHPLGLPTVLSWLYARDPSMQTMVYFQFIVCALMPLAVGGLAWAAFGPASGKLAVAASSMYFPFVDYGGYFLTEIHFAFTLALGVGLALFAVRQKKVVLAVAIGLLAGLAFSLSQVTKVMGFPAMACFLFFFVAFWRGAPRRIRGGVLLAVVLAAVPINAWQFSRCTTANHGHFCLGTTKGASDFLLGHYGRIYSVTWHDPGGDVIWFGSPSAAQHGYTERVDMDFKLTDNAKNLEMALEWIKDHPQSALFLSLEHVYDLFFGSFPWPSVSTKHWLGAAGGHYIFIMLLFFPSCVRLLDILRRDGPGSLLGSTEVLLLAPLIGLVVTAAIATGEPRYRFPFDSLFIVVSIEFFRNFRIRGTGARAGMGDQ
jgi:hypothetical protein